MSSILCCRSKKGIVMLARNTKQAIYNINNTLVGVKKPGAELTDLLKNAGPYLRKNPVREFLRDNCMDVDDILVASWGRGPEVSKSRKREASFRPAGALEYFSDMERTIVSRLGNAMDSGLKLSYLRDMGDMLEVLYSISDDNEACLQLGFVDKYGAKTLFYPDVEFLHPPQEYQKRGVFNRKRQDANNGFFKTLKGSLDRTQKLKKKDPAMSYRKSFFLPGKRKPEKSLREARKDTDDIICRYMDYRHGPLERFTIRSYLDDAGKERPKKDVPVIGSIRRYTLQQRLDREFLPRDTKSILVRVRARNYPRSVQDCQHHLEKELGAVVKPMINIPCISITGDAAEVNRLYSHIGRRRFSVFGRKASTVLSSASRVERSHGVFYPELIQEFVTGERRRVIPMRTYNKNALWNLEKIGAISANKVTTGQGVKIAVVDTGADYRHQEISGNFDMNMPGINIVSGTDDPMDGEGHGTHVAGTIAGESTGIAKDCRLYAVRVLDDDGSGSLHNILLGIDWCITNDIDIVNLSLGSPASSFLEQEMFDKAYRSGVISVAAAGNSGYGPSYPASYDSVIAVAATDREDGHPDFSNIYYTNNVSAPGVGIMSSMLGGGYAVLSGTSMATPHVAGSCGLIASVKGVDKDSVQKIIEDTAKPLGDRDEKGNWEMFGCGLVQADKAVDARGKRWRRSA